MTSDSKSDPKGETCEFPQLETKLSSLDSLSLTPELGVAKLLKRLSTKFRYPSFSAVELEASIGPILASFAYFLSTSWELVPELYYRKPERVPLGCLAKPVSVPNGEISDFEFKSRFVSTYQDYRSREHVRPFETVRIRHWQHINFEAKGTVVAIHGWMLGDEKARALTMVPGIFFRMGLDVVSVVLPFHGDRIPIKLTPLSIFPSLDPGITNEGFAQAIYELRAIASWLKEKNDKPIIPIGLSLGANTAALWASLDKLNAVICAAPISSISELIWSHVVGTPLASRLDEAGISSEILRRAFAVSSPLSYSLRMNPGNALIIASEIDNITSTEQSAMLINHWKGSEVHKLAEGHIEQLVEPSSIVKVHKFLFDRGLANEELFPLVP